ncbi:MAG TPA: discoidin domain-containing protein [Cyclobacteriaceae bacterium]|nr:discoidin domain-containing protein [Cyclobacteriaceae bacterium]
MKYAKIILYLLLPWLLLIGCDKEPEVDPVLDDPMDSVVVEVPEVIIPTPHAIKVQSVGGKAKFWNSTTNTEFLMRGVNYFWLMPGIVGERFFGVGDFVESRVRNDFIKLKGNGYNTVRIFLDLCNEGPGCIANASGGLSSTYLDNIVKTLKIAKEEGVYLILTSNDLPDEGGYWEISDLGTSSQFAGYRNGHYLTAKGVESAQVYWTDLLKGLYDKSAPFDNVLAWSILNEQWYFRTQPPFSLTTGTVTTANGLSYDMSSSADKKKMAVDGMVHYISKVREVMSKYDPNALVTMGFFAPNYPNPIGLGDFRYVETADLLTSANLDFFDFHAYSGDDDLMPLAENFGMLGFESKPIIMGEFGSFVDRYATLDDAIQAAQSWMAESCNYGFDGWLYWGLYRASGVGDATWSFFDEGNELLESMSPNEYPDACDDDLLAPVNVALNKSVTASASISGEEPGKAVDGDNDSQWGAGSAPPQWIEIDLEGDIEISKISLRVGQFPAGTTTHVLEGKSSTGSYVVLKTFTGVTEEADVLIYTPTGPANYRYIKITTTSSPSWVSWKEIEVYD